MNTICSAQHITYTRRRYTNISETKRALHLTAIMARVSTTLDQNLPSDKYNVFTLVEQRSLHTTRR